MKISNLALCLDFTSNIYGRAFDSFGQKTVYFYPDEDYPVESDSVRISKFQDIDWMHQNAIKQTYDKT